MECRKFELARSQSLTYHFIVNLSAHLDLAFFLISFDNRVVVTQNESFLSVEHGGYDMIV